MCSRIASLIMRAYKVQTANLTLYKQHKTTNLDDMSCAKWHYWRWEVRNFIL